MNNTIDIIKTYDLYKKDTDILTGDTEDMQRLKDIIFEGLNETERRIILLYAELGTQRKVAEALGVSLFVINREIRRIREEIKDSYDKRNS